MSLTQKQLKEILHYNLETGKWTWKVRLANRRLIGSQAGTTTVQGYIGISILNKRYLAHHLAWLYMTGEWSKTLIDHINGEKHNNQWINLREANYSQNSANSKLMITNSSGYKGVIFIENKKKCWHARICKNYKIINLGYFYTKEEAILAYQQGADKYFGEFARY